MNEKAIQRGELKYDIEHCIVCEAGEDKGGIAWNGKGEVMFVGDSPEKEDWEQRKMFAGGLGKMVRAFVEEAGLEDKAGYVRLTGCPASSPPKELNNCRRWFLKTMEVVEPEVIVWVGGEAMRQWRKDLQITKAWGKWGIWNDRVACVGMPHPLGIKHRLETKTEIREVMKMVYDVVVGGVDWRAFGWGECGKCGVKENKKGGFDLDGVWYCGQHVKQYGKIWKEERKKWKNIQVVEEWTLFKS